MLNLLGLICIAITLSKAAGDGSNSRKSESAALQSLKENVSDPSGSLSNWNSNQSLCQWNGVSCSSTPNGRRVTSLSLASLALSIHTFSNAIHSLSALQHLLVRQSNFSGSITDLSLDTCSLVSIDLSTSSVNLSASDFPGSSLGACTALKHINLSHTQLYGEFIGELLVPDSLETLDLSSNALTGHFSLNSCTSLKHLDLSANQFTGELSPELFTGCSSLEVIQLEHNSFSGAFPKLTSLSGIQELNLAHNGFSSLNVTSCSNLTRFNVAYNQLTSQTLELATPCPSMKLLNISSNNFTGTIFSVLGIPVGGKLPSKLEVLDASYNGFSGRVPRFSARLRHVDFSSNAITSFSCSNSSKSRLDSLILPNNRLIGRLLDSVVENCSPSLKMLDLGFNGLTGEIPPNLCERLPALENLLLWANNLYGLIPPSLSKCESLIVLVLGFNNFHGTIPEELSLLRNLSWVGLGSNILTGGIPAALGDLKNLVQLHLSNNSLEGEIPGEILQKAQKLQVLELGGNRLTGRLPTDLGGRAVEVVGVGVVGSGTTNLRLARGQHPTCSGRDIMFAVQGIRLDKLRELLAERSGCDSIVNFVPAPDFRTIHTPLLIDVSHNRLTGSIQDGIGAMIDLWVLNLADNRFSGQLSPALGKLENLFVLDVSQNDLQGIIPENFARLRSIQVFNVSYNNLSGMIPQAGQVNLFEPSSYEGNPLLCGVPIRACSSLMPQPLAGRKSRDHNGWELDGIMVWGLVFGIATFAVSASVSYTGVGLFLSK